MNNFTDENQDVAGVYLSDLYKEYHDQEGGTPVYDDATLFEFLLLNFQAGLSWITILNKRENFRAAFDQFD
jgi:DNA-3-methyladenine glycosylase I